MTKTPECFALAIGRGHLRGGGSQGRERFRWERSKARAAGVIVSWCAQALVRGSSLGEDMGGAGDCHDKCGVTATTVAVLLGIRCVRRASVDPDSGPSLRGDVERGERKPAVGLKRGAGLSPDLAGGALPQDEGARREKRHQTQSAAFADQRGGDFENRW